MAVIRSPLPNASFTMVRNCWVRDQRVSLKAKGLLVYLLSHAEGYKCSQAQMVRESTDGRDAIKTALEELAAAGYLRRTAQRSAGRFAEDDYALADPFDADGRIIRTDPAADTRETRQSGFAAADEPLRQIRPIEEQGEKTPSPTEKGGRHLTPVETETQARNAAAQELTREHYDASGGLARFPAVLAIVKRALTATKQDGSPWYSTEQVRGALRLLRESGRPVTLETMRAALTTPESVAGARYRAGPYRNPDPATDPAAFSGSF